MPHTQLSNYERYVITHMHQAGRSNAQIARELGRHRASIGRELRRNRDVLDVYHYLPAQRSATHRRSEASRRYKLDDPASDLGRYVRQKLRQRWSPQQIQGRLEREHRHDLAMRITHETIYRFIYRRHQHHGERWHEQLRRRHKRRRSRVVGQRTCGGRGPDPRPGGHRAPPRRGQRPATLRRLGIRHRRRRQGHRPDHDPRRTQEPVHPPGQTQQQEGPPNSAPSPVR